MNKFILLKTVNEDKKRGGLYESDYYLINVSQIIWIHPQNLMINIKQRSWDTNEIFYVPTSRDVVSIRFEDGSTLMVLNSKEELLEMMILKPWWKNLIDSIRWLFIKKHK